MVLGITIFTIISNIFLGLLVYIRNQRSITHILFLLFAAFVALWSFTNYLSLNRETPEESLLFIRIVLATSAAMFSLLYLLVVNFPSAFLKISRFHLVAVLGFLGFTLGLSFSPFVFSAVEVHDGLITPIPGPGILLFALNVLGLPILSLITLFRMYKNAQGFLKEQILWLLLGVGITFILTSLTNFILVNAFKNAELVVLGPFFTLVFVGFASYAIIKHRLLDIQIIVARAASFLVILILAALAYILILFVGIQKIIGIAIEPAVLTGALIITIIGIFTFQPIDRFIRSFTNRIFFKGQYDRDKLLSKLTRIMASTIDLNSMTEQILNVLTREMRITKAAFLIIDKHKITDMKGVGYHDHEFEAPELEKLFHKKSSGYDGRVIFEELDEGAFKDIFRKIDIFVAIPIRVEKQEVAILILGPKLSGEIYHQRDIGVLDIFASEAGIAIQNAKAYTEIKKFSEELEERVFKRTVQLEESQRRELAKAQEVARLKDEFVFVAAHELRTPVTVIRGFLELVSESEKNFPKDVQEHLDAISLASDHLNQLVNDLLEVSRSESGALKVEVEAIDIIPIIKFVKDELSPIADKKNVKININIDAKKAMVMADQGKVEEVATNLINNAVKYNKEGGSVDISILIQDREIIVEIRDTGYGMPKDQQEKIFQKFYRARSKDTQGTMGTGLGLFITRILVEKMGGRVMFTSLEGEGSTFAFSLPRAR